jgi:pantoate--beta-alanine ligase
MKIARTAAQLREALARQASIGLVPTMGAFHDGHLSLFSAAREECDQVVVSLFVNPAQFAPGDDLDRYPRDEKDDERRAEEAGVDLLFIPAAEEM